MYTMLYTLPYITSLEKVHITNAVIYSVELLANSHTDIVGIYWPSFYIQEPNSWQTHFKNLVFLDMTLCSLVDGY